MPGFSGLGQGRRPVCSAVCVTGPWWKKVAGRSAAGAKGGWSLGCAGRLEGTGLATAQGLLCSLDLVFQGESVS